MQDNQGKDDKSQQTVLKKTNDPMKKYLMDEEAVEPS